MGLATATLLASRGAFLSLADVNEENLQKAIAALSSTTSSKSSADTSGAGGAPGTRHMSYVVDVRSSATIDAWIEATVQKFGRLDGAVNMAGIITPAKPITETTDEAWGFSMDVNAKGVFACLRAELKTMNEGGSIVSEVFCFSSCLFFCTNASSLRHSKAATPPPPGASHPANKNISTSQILNTWVEYLNRFQLKSVNHQTHMQVSTSSTFGQFGAPGNAPYCASKAAVIALTRTAAKENPKIRVNVVAPGEQRPL